MNTNNARDGRKVPNRLTNLWKKRAAFPRVNVLLADSFNSYKMMTQLPYVLVILFAMENGGVMVMETSQQHASPLTCSMQALLHSERHSDRTYVCMTRQHAGALFLAQRQQAAAIARD